MDALTEMYETEGVQIFNNLEFGSVRTVTIDEEPYFVGKDIAGVLGYANASKAVMMHVDVDDKTKIMMRADSQNGNVVTETTVINESGLYSLILSSKLPGAKRFKRWVTSDVLPAIRKHGMYATDELLNDPDLMIRVLQEYKAEREQRRALQAETASQKKQIEEMTPKVSYYDKVLSSASLTPITTIAKDYGWSGVHMNKYLHEQGVQYKQGERT